MLYCARLKAFPSTLERSLVEGRFVAGLHPLQLLGRNALLLEARERRIDGGQHGVEVLVGNAWICSVKRPASSSRFVADPHCRAASLSSFTMTS